MSAVQHAIGNLPIWSSYAHAYLIPGLESLNHVAQLLERSQREMRSDAEAEIAHDGALGAITDPMFDDSTREGNRTGDPAILVLPLDAISDLVLERGGS